MDNTRQSLVTRMKECKTMNDMEKLDNMRLEIVQYINETLDSSVQQDFIKALNRCRRNGFKKSK